MAEIEERGEGRLQAVAGGGLDGAEGLPLAADLGAPDQAGILEDRAAFLEAIARNLLDLGDDLIVRCMAEIEEVSRPLPVAASTARKVSPSPRTWAPPIRLALPMFMLPVPTGLTLNAAEAEPSTDTTTSDRTGATT
jgi:hypothetical protein